MNKLKANWRRWLRELLLGWIPDEQEKMRRNRARAAMRSWWRR